MTQYRFEIGQTYIINHTRFCCTRRTAKIVCLSDKFGRGHSHRIQTLTLDNEIIEMVNVFPYGTVSAKNIENA